ncbi:MAG TPA: hypothetical protein VIJ41_00255 [Candidatus Nanopelagicales bacterium]
MDEGVVVTVLPWDTADGLAVAGLYVSPRLVPDVEPGKVQEFGGFSRWPELVRALESVTLSVDGRDVTARIVPSDPAPHDAWFTGSLGGLPVRTRPTPALAGTPVRSYDYLATHDAVAAVEQSAARSGQATSRRVLGEVRNATDILSRVIGKPRVAAEILDGRAGEEDRGGVVSPTVVDAQGEPAPGAIGQLLVEHAAWLQRQHDPAPPPVPEPEFHAVVGGLGAHPALLRAFGLLLEVRFEAGELGARGFIRLAKFDGDAEALRRPGPVTGYAFDDPWFEPWRDGGEVTHGMVPLADAARAVVRDVDGGAIRLANAATSGLSPASASDGGPPTDDAKNPDKVPAGRGGGITVAASGGGKAMRDMLRRGQVAHDSTEAGDPNPSPAPPEALWRGLRPEVLDETDGEHWRSLVARQVTYRLFDPPLTLELVDEGHVSTSSADTTADGALYTDDVLFGWDGWSLAVPRPGRHVRGDGADPDDVADAGEPLPAGLPVDIAVSVAGSSLPRLRYGTSYVFRARRVDLAGHSTALPDNAHAGAKATHGRSDVLTPPAVVLRHDVVEGESLQRLVVRSAVEYTDGVGAPTVGPWPADTRDTSDRHLAPPHTTVVEAERNGRFDAAFDVGGAEITRAFAVARKEEGTFVSAQVWDVSDPDAPRLVPADGLRLVPTAGSGLTTADADAALADLQAHRGRGAQAGYLVVHDTDHPRTPYLPDSLAEAAVVAWRPPRTLGGAPDALRESSRLTWSGDWPELGAWRLSLARGNGAAADGPVVTRDDVARVLTVTLPAGRRLPAAVSSATTDRGADSFTLVQEIGGPLGADAAAGLDPTVTPPDDVELVHAVSRPLARPVLDRWLTASRPPGDAGTFLSGDLGYDGPSTSRIDLEATWTVTSDDPATDGPTTSPRTAVGFSEGHPGWGGRSRLVASLADIHLLHDDGSTTTPCRHEITDMRHHLITYTPRATTAFREYFPAAVATDAGATSVTGDPVQVHVPASVRPALPVVRQVIPTFRWHDGEEAAGASPAVADTTCVRTRIGGLRVYLERSWFSSGEDEMLGVVLSGLDGDPAPDSSHDALFSQWGLDPARGSGVAPARELRPQDLGGDGRWLLPSVVVRGAGQNGRGAVVGHPVRYDASRRLWACDIAPDPGEAHWPFLRLALARMQPYAVAGEELSEVVVPPMLTVPPRRELRWRYPDPGRVVVALVGVVDAGQVETGGSADHHAVRAWMEQVAAEVDGEQVWRRVGDTVPLARVDASEIVGRWVGVLPTPEPIRGRLPVRDPNSEFRLVVEEYERWPEDAAGVSQQRLSWQPRLVYRDAVRL